MLVAAARKQSTRPKAAKLCGPKWTNQGIKEGFKEGNSKVFKALCLHRPRKLGAWSAWRGRDVEQQIDVRLITSSITKGEHKQVLMDRLPSLPSQVLTPPPRAKHCSSTASQVRKNLSIVGCAFELYCRSYCQLPGSKAHHQPSICCEYNPRKLSQRESAVVCHVLQNKLCHVKESLT